MSRWLPVIIIFFLLSGCTSSDNKNLYWKTMQVGNYIFEFPPEFKQKFDKNIDSSGIIENDSISLSFNFSYLADDLEETPDEALEKFRKDLKEKNNRTDTPYFYIISLKQTGTSEYVAQLRLDDNTECEYHFNNPALKLHNFKTDTIDKLFRKIIYSKDPRNGITGIYIKPLQYSKTNTLSALSISTCKLSKEQQALVLKIFMTGRQKIIPY